MTTQPYVSFVICGRNDGYTPNYLRRVKRAAACLVDQLQRAAVPSELVIVEWNPPADRPLMLESLDLPAYLPSVSVRGVIVPAGYHPGFVGAHERGIHVSEATNVGIRRARGRFVTSKASDTFFSPELVAMIARQDLDPGTVYRVDRHDIVVDDETIWSLDDDQLLKKLAALPSTPHAWIEQVPYWRLRELHTNACGDFTLMTHECWHALRGYPFDETVLALDLDSLLLHAAAARGLKEHRWPDTCRIYKPAHANVNGVRISEVWKPWQWKLDRFLADHVSMPAAHWARTTFNYPRRKVRGIDSVVGPSIERNFVLPASKWARGVEPMQTQPETWGLGLEDLEESYLCRATWDAPSPARAQGVRSQSK